MIELANHWLVTVRGGEKVLKQLCKIAPEACVYTLVHKQGAVTDVIGERRIRTSLIQSLPFGCSKYKQLLPLHPLAIGRLSCDPETKLFVSSDASMIKGIRLPAQTVHVCYCHSPPRYLWEMSEEYRSQTSGLGRFGKWVFGKSIEYCKRFDWNSAQRVDQFVANSQFVQERISRHYGKDSLVVYPPVDVEDFNPTRPRDDFYLVVSQLVPYKKIDIAVDAFSRSGKQLVVIGEGGERRSLQKRAGPSVKFLGRQPFSVLKDHYERCRAFIFPGVEDFGITPVEAMAAGSPVIAFAKGGVLESVVADETGVFFEDQSPDSLNEAIEKFESLPTVISSSVCRQNSERFRPERFVEEMRAVLVRTLDERDVQVPGINAEQH